VSCPLSNLERRPPLSGFWETEISVGRLRYPRSAIFLNHWLIARTGEEVVAREVFDRFKRYTGDEVGLPMAKVLQQVHAAAGVYRQFTVASMQGGPIDRLGLFGYRTGVLESEVIKPLVLCLLDPEEPSIPQTQLVKALDVVESWMVRRMLVRATTKNYNQVVAELVALVRKSDRAKAGDEIESYLAGQSSESRYWPDDVDLQRELEVLPAYRRLGRGRLRMVLEAIEDYLRGWRNGKSGLGGERVARGRLAIEHVMPRKWQTHWPVQAGGEADRDGIIHTLGNLTLLTKKLNSKVSNGPWVGSEGKRNGLHGHDVLMLNRQLLEKAGERWTDDAIHARTQELAAIITQLWPVPPNHRSNVTSVHPRLRKMIDLSDLITGGVLVPSYRRILVTERVRRQRLELAI
jgi:GNAT superfamily N-acetyltransferase